MPAAAGYVIFGAPPVASAARMADAFLPNPAMNVGFTADVSPELASVPVPGAAMVDLCTDATGYGWPEFLP